MSNENDGSLDPPLLETPPMGGVSSSIASSQSFTAIQRPRILDREGRFSQSRGRWSVTNTERGVRYRRPRDLVVSFNTLFNFITLSDRLCEERVIVSILIVQDVPYHYF